MISWKKVVIFTIIFIGIILIFNSVIMPWYVKHDTLVKVPIVTGMSVEEAKKKLEEADLEGVQGDIRYDPAKPIGTVIDQNPPAEQTVKVGRRIYLVISGGEQLYEVPLLVGRTLREAKFTLLQRNLKLVEVSYKPSVQYPPGIIISQVEQAGSKVKKGTQIGVEISTGMDAGDLKVPDLLGKNIEEAKKILLQNKLAIGKINYQPSTNVPLNAVIDQYPKANTLAKENQKIDLFVNREVKPKVEKKEEEMNSTIEDKDSEENKDLKDKENVPDQPDKKDTKQKTPDSKDDKKKTEPPKTKDKKQNEKKEDDGTKF